MLKAIKHSLRSYLKSFGVMKADSANSVFAQIAEAVDAQIEILEKCRPFTMTSDERKWALINSIEYISKHNIPGAVVECGVWKGGSMMISALELLRHQDIRELFLYDTFGYIPAPTAIDQHQGKLAAYELKKFRDQNPGWKEATLEEVRGNMASTGYPVEKIKFVSGLVEETLRRDDNLPNQISVLRLDTDWYESTKIEMAILFPRLSRGGVLILDDFGYWDGAKRAVEEYFATNPMPIVFHRTDRSGRIAVKI
jgi:hypothetical protein